MSDRPFQHAPGWRVDRDGVPGTTEYRYFNSRTEADMSDWFQIPEDCWAIVAHNMQYEMSCLLCRHRKTLEDFLKRGGRVLCTAYAEYMLSDQTTLYPSLDETAPKYGGSHKVDGVKIFWESGRLTTEIDKELLITYLAGPEGDVNNTALTFYGQYAKLVERGAWQCYLERCDALIAYSYCEFFGLKVDVDKANDICKQQELEIQELRKELDGLLPKDAPPEMLEDFSWASDYDVSALLYGGPIKYSKKVSYDPVAYVKADYYHLIDGGRVLCQYVGGDDWDSKVVKYASGKNKGLPKVFKEDTDVEKLKWGEFQYRLPGLVKLSALPEVVREKFLGKRAEFRGKRVLCDGVTPVYSSSADALEAIKLYCPEVRLMTKLATMEKDTGAFYLRTEYTAKGEVKRVSGMLQYVQPDGIIHHNLNATATVTARMSSSQPNLQQLPRGDEQDDPDAFQSRVKEIFVSRFGEQGSIIEVDYSALEVVMLAGLSKDRNLLQRLIDKTDMHCYRLAYKLGEDYNEVKRKCKDESHPEHARYKRMRTEIKRPSFAAQYGASAHGIAFATGCTVEFAQEFLDNEAAMFPDSIAYRDVIRESVERTGALPENIHREMNDAGMWKVYRRGYWQAPSGTRYSFRQVPQWKDGQEVMDYKPTQLANYWNQGEAGFLMAVSMGRICRWMLSNDWFGGKACLINNVHDAAYADCADDETTRIVGLGIKAIMEDAPKYITQLWPLYDMLDVPFPAAAEAGRNMHDKSHLE